MSYVKLTQIQDTPDFVAAAKSLGWDETNYGEILKDIGEENGYIVNYDIECQRPRGTADEVQLYFTIGSDIGNRWYSAGQVDVIINKNGVWAKLSMIDDICC